MASTLTVFLRNCNSSLLQNINRNLTYIKCLQPQAVRFLYSKSTLGLDGFEQQRERTKAQLGNITDKFKTKMIDYTQDEAKNMIFTEDLKNMVHLAENDDDVELVMKMMKRFNQQNKELRFGSFVFGPVIMRMFYILNKPDLALECFKSNEYSGFFDQLMSYQLLFDLLYENKMYQEVLESFDLVKRKQIEAIKFPKNIVVLTLAACYRLNTPESYKYAMDLWSEILKVGHLPMRRAVTFLGGLALKQGHPGVVMEAVSSHKNQNYTTIRNLKVSALVELGRIEDALPILKSILNTDQPTQNKSTFNKEVVEKAKTAFEKCDSAELKAEFARVEKYLAEQGHISNETLDDQLCSNIMTPAYVRRPSQFVPRNRSYQQYNNDEPRNPRRFTKRPGLAELQ